MYGSGARMTGTTITRDHLRMGVLGWIVPGLLPACPAAAVGSTAQYSAAPPAALATRQRSVATASASASPCSLEVSWIMS